MASQWNRMMIENPLPTEFDVGDLKVFSLTLHATNCSYILMVYTQENVQSLTVSKLSDSPRC